MGMQQAPMGQNTSLPRPNLQQNQQSAMATLRPFNVDPFGLPLDFQQQGAEEDKAAQLRAKFFKSPGVDPFGLPLDFQQQAEEAKKREQVRARFAAPGQMQSQYSGGNATPRPFGLPVDYLEKIRLAQSGPGFAAPGFAAPGQIQSQYSGKSETSGPFGLPVDFLQKVKNRPTSAGQAQSGSGFAAFKSGSK